MTSVIKNEAGFVVAYCEWEIVNADGQFENNGKYIYIQNIWIHDKHRKTSLLRDLAEQIYNHRYTRNSKYVYWEIYRDIKRKNVIRVQLTEKGEKVLSDSHEFTQIRDIMSALSENELESFRKNLETILNKSVAILDKTYTSGYEHQSEYQSLI